MRRGVRVPKEEAQSVKERLRSRGVLDTDHKPISEDDHVVFPVHDGFTGDTVKRRFEPFNTTPSFQEAAASFLDEEEQDLLIHSYDTIGDIAVIQVPEALQPKAERLGGALLAANPALSTVRRRGAPRHGQYRLQETIHVAGEDKTTTVHVEHGVELRVDINDVYFSPRLSTERGRIASQVGEGEEVLVMFSGCAPYPCVVAALSSPDRVVAVEMNPAGHRLARHNVERNGFEDVVSLHRGDVRDVVPHLSSFDRVVMPAPKNAVDHVDLLRSALKHGGDAHVYSFVENEAYEGVAGSVEDETNLVVEGVTVCGERSPGVERVCFDAVSRTL